jgi:hypothetical protein
MGRYYNGDIEGKFWFAVQHSTCGEQFGAIEVEPDYIPYCIKDSKIALERLIEIRKELGDKLKLFVDFFKTNNGYNDGMLIKYFENQGFEFKEEDLRLYADYTFGEQVVEYFKKNEDLELYYDAEL